MVLDEKNFTQQLAEKVKSFKPKVDLYTIGRIVNLGDGIAKISGLPDAMYNELLAFPQNLKGLVFNLEKKQVGAIILGKSESLKEGDEVQTTGKVLQVPAGETLLGRVITPLANPLDGKGNIQTRKTMSLERIAPGVVFRQPVDTPLQTGVKAIDSMIPIGRGQRELIIGDRGTGKTAITIDAIINQKGEGVICIYVAIGQKQSRIAKIIETLKTYEAMDYTIVVSASASEPASLQYIAPFAGCAIGEYFVDQGKDVLIIYDDLTKHAWAYRQLSLLLRRPSGREAYPGDIFYLHSRLLERACKLSNKLGGGSLTALPIIETQAGDISSYIPTNVISITDGQIYLESDLFFAGIRPALNTGLSVSRVGGAAQVKAMKKVAGKLRLDMAQYRELAAFAQFTTELDPETRKKIERGSRITEILKQPQNQPIPVSQQIIILWVAINGFLDDIPVKLIGKFENQFLEFCRNSHPTIITTINKTKDLEEKLERELKQAVEDFKINFKTEYKLEEENG